MGGIGSITELDFCAKVAEWSNVFFASSDSPFERAAIEGTGSGTMRRKRKDLRFYDRTNGKLALTGEVRLPGAEDDSPYGDLADDAFRKADNAGVQYFFTWNVNTFVLWDRGRWDVPLLQRRVGVWPLGRYLRAGTELALPENLEYIRTKFLPELLISLGRIYRGQAPDWPLKPDDLFIQSLGHYLSWPIETTRAHLATQAAKSKPFERRLIEWMTGQDWVVLRKDEEQWSAAVYRAAQTLVHLLANRLIFYQALRARFTGLPALQFRGIKTAVQAYAHLQQLFQRAVAVSGDYDTLLYPEEEDWAGRLVFEGTGATGAWQAALKGIERYDFAHIGSDVVGKVFQKLVSPEERHRWGQHFTGDDVVDLVNAFCIRDGNDTVLDPACGSGSFLVRAYYRKQWLDPRKAHAALIAELFGCDIALYPSHLATLNLAAREINDEANYPRIARKDFFDISAETPFCELPPDHSAIQLPKLAAIVGNPPYVRQEKIPDKGKLAGVAAKRAAGLRLSGRSDIHCYFWPAATTFLQDGGYFGFLTSSSWLDVEYGFALQKWILQSFKIIAILESAREPWFEDARVKTCATILQRCADAGERAANVVRFVRVKRPLAEIVEIGPEQPEARFKAFDALRDRILAARESFEGDSIRVMLKTQRELWDEGLRTSAVLRGAPIAGDSDDNSEEEESAAPVVLSLATTPGEYAGGKWGRYLRAPSFYFEVMRDLGARFVPLGEIVEIRRGITSGCDDFFMPHDITREALEFEGSERDFRRAFRGASREEVQNGAVKIVRAGDGSKHPIEAKYLRPEVHTLRDFQKTQVSAGDCDRMIVLVNDPMTSLRGSWIAQYLRYGETHTFLSDKSKPVPVPKRSTCASRDPWYNLVGLVRPSLAFWPMAHHYRHVIPFNPESLICNHRMFDVMERESNTPALELAAILNCTIVALWKTFYGRYTGTEGSLDTEVIDARMIEIPNPRRAAPIAVERIQRAFTRMSQRPIGRMVEEQLMDCHSPERAAKIAAGPLVLAEELRQPDRRELDDAVFELLGVESAGRRRDLVDRLYAATAAHFREIRVVEIQKMEQRSKSKARRIGIDELAADAWDAIYFKDEPSIADWVRSWPERKVQREVPTEGMPRLVDAHAMFDKEIVFFGDHRHAQRVVCSSRGQAELIARLATLGVRGALRVPDGERECRRLMEELGAKLEHAHQEFETIASERIADEKKRAEMIGLMMQWRIHGKPSPRSRSETAAGEDAGSSSLRSSE